MSLERHHRERRGRNCIGTNCLLLVRARPAGQSTGIPGARSMASPLPLLLLPTDIVEQCLLFCSPTDLLVLSSCCTWLRCSVEQASVWEHALAKRHKAIIDAIFGGIVPQPPAMWCALPCELAHDSATGPRAPQSAAACWKRYLFDFHNELLRLPSPAIDSAIDSGLFRAAANIDYSNAARAGIVVRPEKTQRRRHPLMLTLASGIALCQWAACALAAAMTLSCDCTAVILSALQVLVMISMGKAPARGSKHQLWPLWLNSF